MQILLSGDIALTDLQAGEIAYTKCFYSFCLFVYIYIYIYIYMHIHI